MPFEVKNPNIARMYDYMLGGKDHFAADRDAAQSILADFPEVQQVARANRQFVTRAVRHVAGEGIRQFIDVGAGLPTAPAVHQTAQEVNPGARVAYVDNDPLVLAYARALLAKGPGVTVIPGDLRDPAPILANPDLRLLLDLDQPVCVLLASVLHFLLPAEADASVATFRAAMAPGSYLIVSAGTSTGTSPALIDRLRSAYADTSDITGRPAEEIAAWLTGLDLIPPGLVNVDAWRPGSPRHWLTPRPPASSAPSPARPPARPAPNPPCRAAVPPRTHHDPLVRVAGPDPPGVAGHAGPPGADRRRGRGRLGAGDRLAARHPALITGALAWLLCTARHGAAVPFEAKNPSIARMYELHARRTLPLKHLN